MSACIKNGHDHRATHTRSIQDRRVQRQTVLAGGRPFFADYSFTLYLIHYTIMFAIRSLWPDNGWYAFFLAIVVSNAIAAFMAIFTEMRHRLLASFLNRKRQIISLGDVTAGF